MSKYIIDTDDVIGYTPKYAMLFGDGYMIQPLDYLDELNSDYINDHYGELQDVAYQKGLDDAWEAVKKIYLDGVCKMISGENFNSYIKTHSASEAIEMIKANDHKKVKSDIQMMIDCLMSETGMTAVEIAERLKEMSK